MESNTKHTVNHIGFITPEYPHAKVKHAAGIGTSVKNLAVALVKQNMRVSVFIYHQDLDGIEETDGVTLHFIKHKSYPLLGWYLYRKHINTYVNRVVKQDGVQLIEAADWTGITAFMRFKVPLVLRLHGTDAYFCKLEGRQQKKKNFWLEKQAIRRADAYIAPTDYAGKITAELFEIPFKKIRVIHNGIDAKKFENKTPKIYLKNQLLYAGTLIRKKGVLELARIFNKVVEAKPDSTLVLIGADAYDIKTASVSTFELMTSALSDAAKQRVNYLGKVSYEQVITHMCQSHICVFPTMAETFGMVTVEAMALHKPVVNSNYEWAQEIIKDGYNGYLETPKNHQAFADKIIKLLEIPIQCLELGKCAQKTVGQKFDTQIVIPQNIAFYNSLLQ